MQIREQKNQEKPVVSHGAVLEEIIYQGCGFRIPALIRLTRPGFPAYAVALPSAELAPLSRSSTLPQNSCLLLRKERQLDSLWEKRRTVSGEF